MEPLEIIQKRLDENNLSIKDLHPDTQDEYDELKKIISNKLPSIRDGEGKFKPAVERKILRLTKSIVAEISNIKDDKAEETQKAEELKQQQEAERLQKEEEERKKNNPDKKKEQQKTEPKKKSFFDLW